VYYAMFLLSMYNCAPRPFNFRAAGVQLQRPGVFNPRDI